VPLYLLQLNITRWTQCIIICAVIVKVAADITMTLELLQGGSILCSSHPHTLLLYKFSLPVDQFDTETG